MSSTTSYTPDPHAVPNAEARSYYAGLHSKPIGPEGWCRLKELCEVFTHAITKVWNDDLAWKVVDIMDAHEIRFTTIDVVRFKEVGVDEAPEDEEDVEGEEEDEDEETVEAKKPVIGPVTIWVGVFPESTSATAAHNAAQDVLALLKDYQITDVDIEYRESFYTREAGPQLLQPVHDLDPLVNVVSPLIPALGLRISTKARPDTQGTMALYLAEGGDSNNLLGLSCRHILIGPKEANIEYVSCASAPSRDVLLLGKGAFTNLVNSIKLRIGRYGIAVEHWRRQIVWFVERQKGTNTINAEEVEAARIETQRLLSKAENMVEALGVLLDQVNKDWKKPNNRVLGHVLRSPAISLGVGEHRFTEDWGIFWIDRAKLGDGFQGNKLDLGTKLTFDEFTVKCFTRGDANWAFEYPHNRLLPLIGTITDELMRTPDMWDSDGELCLLVVKSGSATDTTLGRANGVFSIVRDYFNDMSVNQTSMEWGIINYDSKSEVFSEPGDSGSIIADIRGRIGGMITGGSGKTESSDITYATPFWWLLKRIRANGFPYAHLDVLA
ncbi:hypothetical protein BDM02DRAFT_3128052 [Thelephora ganbajun]|uniref:Uncharacterized protein n=1 Tax=Thelephora ganbajun TaxID=370292 RepID=A0ACB6ZJE6_THEGA|nr:hypothetical protein BDM02DRAFT_3128052 [Thelephora ganbajun]